MNPHAKNPHAVALGHIGEVTVKKQTECKMRTPENLLKEMRKCLETAEREFAKSETWQGADEQQTIEVRRAYRFGVWKMANAIRAASTILSREIKAAGL